MAKQTDTIKKDGQIFYALIQLTFGQDPVFALGDREIGMGMISVDMLDKQTNLITKDCLLHITKTTNIVQPPNKEESVDLNAPTSHIDPTTPRYWLTNTNYD